MKTIASFTINHEKLLPGVYVSRKDKIKDVCITTIDIRMTRPNLEPVLDTACIHALEHLGATFLRNQNTYKEDIIYFGPMGCRTGFYLVIARDYTSDKIAPLIREMFEYIASFDGVMPGASAIECGNYLDINLSMAKYSAKKYINEVLNNLSESNLNYF